MRKNKLLLGLGAIGMSLTLAACGGSGDRPSVQEISKVIQAEGDVDEVPKEGADCIAKVFHDSDLSDEFLTKAVEGGAEFDVMSEGVSEEDREVFMSQEFSEASMECFEEMFGDMELPEGQTELAPEVEPLPEDEMLLEGEIPTPDEEATEIPQG